MLVGARFHVLEKRESPFEECERAIIEFLNTRLKRGTCRYTICKYLGQNNIRKKLVNFVLKEMERKETLRCYNETYQLEDDTK